MHRRMKIFVNCVIIVAAAGIGLAAGFAWRGNQERVSPATGVSTATAPSPELAAAKLIRTSDQRAAVPGTDDSPLATKLERDLSMSSGVTRWLYWLETVEKAAPADFPRLARLAQGNSTLLRLIAARWVELDPRHLFDTIVASSKTGGRLPSELESVLFAEWPKRDPDAVIAALSEAGEFGGRSNWRMLVASRFFEHDVERGLRLMSEWHIGNYGPRMTGVAKWAAADPRHAAEFTLANPAGFASRLTMETIGKEWAKTDPRGALEFAVSTRGELGSTLATAVLKDWAGRNLDESAEWLGTADDWTRTRLSPAFVEAWAKQDATSALAWCEENLTGTSLAQAVGGVLKGAAAKDLAGAAGIVANMHPSPARSEAAVAVAKKWFPDHSSDKPVASELLAWLAKLDGDSRKRVVEENYWRWSETDPGSMAAFLTSANSEDVPNHAYSSLARSLARKDPPQALEWAGGLPAGRALSAGGEVFSEWRRSQPESAMSWLNGLPANDARRQPFFQSAVRSLAHEPHGADQLAAMSAADRAAARSVIETMRLPDDRRATLLEALKPR